MHIIASCCFQNRGFHQSVIGHVNVHYYRKKFPNVSRRFLAKVTIHMSTRRQLYRADIIVHVSRFEQNILERGVHV
jgi:hypothetical protein